MTRMVSRLAAVLLAVAAVAALFYALGYGSGMHSESNAPRSTSTSSAQTTSVTVASTTAYSSTSTPTTTMAATNSGMGNSSLNANAEAAAWYGNVTAYVQGDYLVVKTNDVPPVSGTFPDRSDPNSIEAQNFTFLIPLHPQNASRTITVPAGGQIGVALNGVVFFGPLDANGNDAVVNEGSSFDQCNGHPQANGVYHYHEFSPCIANQTPGQHSPLIGFAFDGYPIYGPDGQNGTPVPQSSLDSCNGHYDSEVGSYVYVATNSFPYLLGCYRGTPVKSDLATGGPAAKT